MQSNVEDMLKRIQDWSVEDLERLIDGLKILIQQQQTSEPLHDIREFRGIGHGTWNEVGGVDEFIRQERASWDR